MDAAKNEKRRNLWKAVRKEIRPCVEIQQEMCAINVVAQVILLKMKYDQLEERYVIGVNFLDILQRCAAPNQVESRIV